MARSRSSILTLFVFAVAVALSWSSLSSLAFAGSSAMMSQRQAMSAPRTATAASPMDMADLPSTMMLSDLSTDAQALPVIAFVCSIFVGVIGYSLYVAFGPGAEDLRDPFEEHED
eukprot:CAMPEP_0178411552 /NCGR_PEP_ID=MMETSP0689_2-20121128/21551_1 /TAXON_ID=160604 /ORGANISM="Amphidinium massartii, Strain CS-259" /LENGTH=114 /DNA_ID=CAMNT_0020032757 /DNA_START=78 /DNA_END=422 /DNA_ORIENTATION=+